MLSSKWLYPFLIFGLLSCHPQESDSKKQGKSGSENISQDQDQEEGREGLYFDVKVARKTEFKKDFSNFERYKQDLNTFEVQFKAVIGKYPGVDIECRKDLFDRDRIVFRTKFDKLGEFAKVEVSIDEKNPTRVNLDCRLIDRGEEIYSQKIKLKKSFIISGTQNIVTSGVGFEEIESLVLDEGSTLVTESMTIAFKVKDLISNNAKIITYSHEDARKTTPNRNGASGAVINIEAENSFGKLSVEMRGTDGAVQLNIPTQNTDIPPADSSLDGTCNGETFEADYDGSFFKPQRCFGKPGFQGRKGFKGFDGYRGGDSGRFNLKVNSEDQLNLDILLIPGNGSDGAKGGLGSRGSKGGIGSTVSLYIPNPDTHGCAACKTVNRTKRFKFPDGPEGQLGEPGAKGNPGLDGEIETSRIEYLKANEIIEINSNWSNF
jgi:hypothetical protein